MLGPKPEQFSSGGRAGSSGAWMKPRMSQTKPGPGEVTISSSALAISHLPLALCPVTPSCFTPPNPQTQFQTTVQLSLPQQPGQEERYGPLHKTSTPGRGQPAWESPRLPPEQRTEQAQEKPPRILACSSLLSAQAAHINLHGLSVFICQMGVKGTRAISECAFENQKLHLNINFCC